MNFTFVETMLPAGHRLHVVLQGIARGFSAVKHPQHRVDERPTQGDSAALVLRPDWDRSA
ncbi:hypothetical protein [Pimelobacter sp. 30-1]|uniref:hypothetical protein n=1 Tax=Pimelobacter sp. 30-1 TaxID=2004991 RepID=UPI001C0501AF|nr:hypothetical protein [Pimelobacter sp. 30-1]MBU2694473.1 hypothetical protein [Pimelobacter sp. 30-1]